EAGAAGKVDARRQGHSLLLWQGDVFRGSTHRPLPLAVPDPDPLADAAVFDALAHCFDDACAVRMRDDAWRDHGPALAALHVGGVHAGCVQPHQHLAGSRFRRFHLADNQDITRFAIPLVPGRLHPVPPAFVGATTRRGGWTTPAPTIRASDKS